MRKRLALVVLGAILSLCGGGVAQAPLATAAEQQESAPAGCKYGQCWAIAKSTGQRCKHCVSNPGDLYCWQHK